MLNLIKQFPTPWEQPESLRKKISNEIASLRREVFGEISSLRKELNTGFYWLIGILITMWITIILAIVKAKPFG